MRVDSLAAPSPPSRLAILLARRDYIPWGDCPISAPYGPAAFARRWRDVATSSSFVTLMVLRFVRLSVWKQTKPSTFENMV